MGRSDLPGSLVPPTARHNAVAREYSARPLSIAQITLSEDGIAVCRALKLCIVEKLLLFYVIARITPGLELKRNL